MYPTIEEKEAKIGKLLKLGLGTKPKTKHKQYYVYMIDAESFLCRNARKEYYLTDEPQQTFTLPQISQVIKVSKYGYGHYLSWYDWILIEE